MSNLDPHEYKNGIKVGQTVSTSDPGVVLGSSKAVAAFVATAAVSFLGALSTALGDQVVTGSEWVTIAIATILSTGLVGGAVYGVATKVTVK